MRMNGLISRLVGELLRQRTFKGEIMAAPLELASARGTLTRPTRASKCTPSKIGGLIPARPEIISPRRGPIGARPTS